MVDEPLIPSYGGCRRQKSFQEAQMVHDVTLQFCDRYVDEFSRIYEKMIQAACSGVQNIVEGNQASDISRKIKNLIPPLQHVPLKELDTPQDVVYTMHI